MHSLHKARYLATQIVIYVDGTFKKFIQETILIKQSAENRLLWNVVS